MPVDTVLSSTQLDATTGLAGTYSYAPVMGTVLTETGTLKLTVKFTPYDTDEYNSATASVELTVTAAKKTPDVSWETPAEVPAGSVLSATQLDATASVPGRFTYSPAAGTLLTQAGDVRLSVAFTPTNTAAYNSVQKSVYLDVAMVTPKITWSTPAPVPAGTTLSATQLNATANVPGSFTFSPAAGTVLTQAGNQKLTTTFTPANPDDYESATASVTLTVTAAATGKPAIGSLSTSSATTGTPVTISGLNFGASQGTSTVEFGATPAAVTAWSNTSITATVPSGLAAGAANVSVTVNGTASNAVAFTVLAPQSTCEQWGVLPISNGAYNYQQNEWNSSLQQCATVSGVGFTLTTADFDMPNGAPAGYPSIYMGCHWGHCTNASASNLPIQVSNLATATTSVETTMPSGYNNDVAYDIWFNQTPTTSGQPNGAEVMIWINHQGFPEPYGSQTGTVTMDGSTWEVWTGVEGNSPSWNVVTYVQDPGGSSVSGLDLMQFFNDAVSRDSLVSTWYLIDVEMGFEVWTGGEGLGISNFAVSVTAQ